MTEKKLEEITTEEIENKLDDLSCDERNYLIEAELIRRAKEYEQSQQLAVNNMFEETTKILRRIGSAVRYAELQLLSELKTWCNADHVSQAGLNHELDRRISTLKKGEGR